jgi:hypothetical protein
MTNNQPATDTEIERVDDEQLRVLFQRLCQAWTDGDAEAYGACFTADCDYVSFDGSIPAPDSLPAQFARGLVSAATAAGVGWRRKGVRTAERS